MLLQETNIRHSLLQYTATHRDSLYCNPLHATHRNTPQHTATHCNPLQLFERIATYCNMLQCNIYDLYQYNYESSLLETWRGLFKSLSRCSVLQCAAVCCSVWPGLCKDKQTRPHTATYCSTLQHTATRYIRHARLIHIHTTTNPQEACQDKATGRSIVRCTMCCSVLQCVAVCCSVLQCVAVWCSVLQCLAVCCSVLQCHRMLYCASFVAVRCREGERERERERVCVCVCLCVCVCVCVYVYVCVCACARTICGCSVMPMCVPVWVHICKHVLIDVVQCGTMWCSAVQTIGRLHAKSLGLICKRVLHK